MDLHELLRLDAVRVVPALSSKKRMFHAVADVAQAVYGLPGDAAVEALMEREALGPTGVGGGIALPHARLNGLDRVCGVFLRSEKPLAYDAVDRKPVDLFFALLAPQDAGVAHLKALALVSRTMRDKALCAKLRANADPAAIHGVLTQAHGSQAA